MATKQEICIRYLQEYLKTSKQGKGMILWVIEGVTSMHRKAIIRKMNALQMHHPTHRKRRGRTEVFGPDVTAAVTDCLGNGRRGM